jgi:hypothetical protein
MSTPEKPYIETINTIRGRAYNPKYGEDRICKCGHAYYRHFDSYDEMDPVGCKYCNCYTFESPHKDVTQVAETEAGQDSQNVGMKAKLGIRYSDNDFNNTIRGFLRTFNDGVMWNRFDLAEKMTKTRVVELFNTLAPGLHILYQSGYRYPGYDFDPSNIRITEENVYFDEEVDKYLQHLRDTRCGNCEFHYYDYQGTLEAEMTGQKLEPVIFAE